VRADLQDTVNGPGELVEAYIDPVLPEAGRL